MEVVGLSGGASEVAAVRARGAAGAPGQLAKSAVSEARTAGAELPPNAQGVAASSIAKGADPASVFSALAPDATSPDGGVGDADGTETGDGVGFEGDDSGAAPGDVAGDPASIPGAEDPDASEPGTATVANAEAGTDAGGASEVLPEVEVAQSSDPDLLSLLEEDGADEA